VTRRGLEAWLAGEPVIVIGNIVENASELYGPTRVRETDAFWLADSRRYAPIATLLAPHVHAVLLSDQVDQRWIADQAAIMGWQPLPAVLGAADISTALSAHALVDDRIRSVLRSSDHPLFPWSGTKAFGALERAFRPSHAVPERKFEESRVLAIQADSKIGANRLFRRISAAHPGIRVPEQETVRGYFQLAQGLKRSRAAAQDLFVKAEYGQAGFGSVPIDAADERPIGAIVDSIMASDERFRTGVIALEERIPKDANIGEIGVDAIALGPGTVVILGAGHMHVDGAHYSGFTIGRHAVPIHLQNIAEEFAADVGNTLADSGYIGWFTVDYVHGRDRTLSPTEINPRCGGSIVAHAVCRRLTGSRRVNAVRTIDHMQLPRPMLTAEALLWLASVRDRSDPFDVIGVAIPPLVSSSALTTLGVVLASETPEGLAAIEGTLSSA
jgi:hypothetical protein